MSMYDDCEQVVLIREIDRAWECKVVTISWLEPYRSHEDALASVTINGWTLDKN